MRLFYLTLLFALLGSCVEEHKLAETQNEGSVEMVVQPKMPQIELELNDRVCAAHIRGLHLLDDKTGWASGTEGTVLRMIDGENWEAQEIAGYTHLDFRDIHGFNSSTALAMAAGEEGRIIRTQDGGKTWTEVYTNLEAGIFLDGIDFEEEKGICIGDPLNGRPLILRSNDGGLTWNREDPKSVGPAVPGEGSYAASGTTVVIKDGISFAAYGGDSLIRVLTNKGQLHGWKSIAVPLRIGQGCGIFSMAFEDKNRGVAVGGCYLDSLNTEGNCALTMDAGKTWTAVTGSPPAGYRSCVAKMMYGPYVTCGRTGIDFSTDRGKSWEFFSNEGFYTMSVYDNVIWLAGRNGKMGRIIWPTSCETE